MSRSKARRYSRIRRVSRLRAKREFYRQWLNGQKNRQANIGNGRPRPEHVKLYIQPFSVDLETDQYIEVGAESPTWNTHASSLTGRTVAAANLGADPKVLEIAGFCEARVVVKQGRSTTGTPRTSKTTGGQYLHYGGTSFSLPFGRLNNTEEYGEAITAVETSFAALPDSIVSFMPET